MPYLLQLDKPHFYGQAQQSGIEAHFITNKLAKEQLSISKGRKQVYGINIDLIKFERTLLKKDEKAQQNL